MMKLIHKTKLVFPFLCLNLTFPVPLWAHFDRPTAIPTTYPHPIQTKLDLTSITFFTSPSEYKNLECYILPQAQNHKLPRIEPFPITFLGDQCNLNKNIIDLSECSPAAQIQLTLAINEMDSYLNSHLVGYVITGAASLLFRQAWPIVIMMGEILVGGYVGNILGNKNVCFGEIEIQSDDQNSSLTHDLKIIKGNEISVLGEIDIHKQISNLKDEGQCCPYPHHNKQSSTDDDIFPQGDPKTPENKQNEISPNYFEKLAKAAVTIANPDINTQKRTSFDETQKTQVQQTFRQTAFGVAELIIGAEIDQQIDGPDFNSYPPSVQNAITLYNQAKQEADKLSALNVQNNMPADYENRCKQVFKLYEQTYQAIQAQTHSTHPGDNDERIPREVDKKFWPTRLAVSSDYIITTANSNPEFIVTVLGATDDDSWVEPKEISNLNISSSVTKNYNAIPTFHITLEIGDMPPGAYSIPLELKANSTSTEQRSIKIIVDKPSLPAPVFTGISVQ